MKLLIIIPAAALLSGCMMFASEIDQVTDKIGDGVDRYCAELTATARAEVRAQVNPTPRGATIVVTCPE
ncbi:MAG: hypothetical protein HKM98_02520 [Gammaproteobacteria bacterium]|nr:hypothetical protein [Gammaproteobacteria bacterium]